jgi:hypothetical protein
MGDKTWTVVGTSVKKGERKLRLANGTAEAREKVLLKDEHTEVRLFDLPHPMTAEAAEAWLREQGDAVPERRPAVPKVKAEPTPRERTVRRVVGDIARRTEGGPLPNEELGRAAHAGSLTSFLAWDDLSDESREEYCRNAAWKAGIPCPKGTYPAIEALLAKEGVVFGPLGELIKG